MVHERSQDLSQRPGCGTCFLPAKDFIETIIRVPKAVRASNALVAINRTFDAQSTRPTTTHESLVRTEAVFENLRKREGLVRRTDTFYAIATEYFEQADLLLPRPFGDRYRGLHQFWKEKGLFNPQSMTEVEFVQSCLKQAGVEMGEGQILTIIDQEGLKGFHHKYLSRDSLPEENDEAELMDFVDGQDSELDYAMATVIADYDVVKHDLITTPHPRKEKRQPLLLMRSVDSARKQIAWMRENASHWFNSDERDPIGLIIGAGKGKEIELLQPEARIIAVDQLSAEKMVEMITLNWQEAGKDVPKIVIADPGNKEAAVREFIAGGREAGDILIIGSHDMDKEKLPIGDNQTDFAVSTNTIHHSKVLTQWLEETDRVTHLLANKGEEHSDEKAITFVDCIPTIAHMERQFLPIIAASGCLTTGWDGLWSHVKALPPEVLNNFILPGVKTSVKFVAREVEQAFKRFPLKTLLINSQTEIVACSI